MLTDCVRVVNVNKCKNISNRPGVAGAVLQTALWLTDWLIYSLNDGLWKYLYGAPTPQRFKMLLSVKKLTWLQFSLKFSISKDIKIKLLVQELLKFCWNKWFFPIGQSGEASRWRVCYQWGLPRLVFAICSQMCFLVFTNIFVLWLYYQLSLCTFSERLQTPIQVLQILWQNSFQKTV